MVFTKESFTEMIDQLDADGDGKVSKAEFKPFYIKSQEPKPVTDGDFDAVWVKIDDDNSGDVSPKELATFFGFTWADVNANAGKMSDEQILSTLAMQAALESEGAKREPSVKQEAKTVKVARDTSIVLVEKKLANIEDTDDPSHVFLRDCASYNTKAIMKALDAAVTPTGALRDGAVNVRTEEAITGETPLHKLARWDGKKGLSTDDDAASKEREAHKEIITKFLQVQKLQADKAGPGKFNTDINHQLRKDGMTPLLILIEFNRYKSIQPLILAGADPMLITTLGWNALHKAVNCDDCKQLVDELFSLMSVERRKILVKQQTKDGRTALHIAAFRAKPEICEALCKWGSEAQKKDKAGFTAGDLARKTGRRRSRDLIESFIQEKADGAGSK